MKDNEIKGYDWTISVHDDGFGYVEMRGVMHSLKILTTGWQPGERWPMMLELDGAMPESVTALMTQDHIDALYEFLHGYVSPANERHVGPERGWRFACEEHDEPGSCTAGCAEILSLMTAPIPDDRPYDPTGCSNPEKERRVEVRLKGDACQMREVVDWSTGITTLESDG